MPAGPQLRQLTGPVLIYNSLLQLSLLMGMRRCVSVLPYRRQTSLHGFYPAPKCSDRMFLLRSNHLEEHQNQAA